MSACGEDDSFGMDRMQFARGEFNGDNARSFPVDHDEIKHLIFIKEVDLVLNALLIQRLQDHVTRAVCGVRGSSHGFASFIVGVPAKRSL